MEATQQTTTPIYKGRPVGFSGKYRDPTGKPIGVYEWRHQNKGWFEKQQAEKKSEETKTLIDQTETFLEIFSKLTGRSKQEIVFESLRVYLAQLK